MPLIEGLDVVNAKTSWSMRRLVELDDAIAEYLDSEPFSLQRQVQPDGVTHFFVLRVLREPPMEIPLLAGEVVHHLRSALDYLAGLLVKANGNEPTRQTAFPIGTKSPANVSVKGGVAPRAAEKIEQLQPYNHPRPIRHPLAVLNELWNVDKHRTLVLAVAMIRNSEIFLSSPEGDAIVGGQFQPGPIGHDGIIGVFQGDGWLDPEIVVHAHGRVYVRFAEERAWNDQRAVTEILAEIHEFVTVQLIPRFGEDLD